MYVYRMSYTRATATRTNKSSFDVFIGSSLNRKPPNLVKGWRDTVKANIESEKETIQDGTQTASTPVPDVSTQFKQTDGCLLGIEKVRKRTHLDYKSLSYRTKQKIRDKMCAFYSACSGQDGSGFVFLTLTFVSETTDKIGVSCLNKFLTVLRKDYGKFEYIWVAERQNKSTGNIHFHIIINRRVDIKKLNALWVVQQYNSGIRHAKADERILNDYSIEGYHVNVKTLYEAGFYSAIQTYLNPVDVKKVNSIDGLSCYLTNYITKNKDQFQCLVWHCSRGVSRLVTQKVCTREQFRETMTDKNKIVNPRTKKVYVNKTFVSEHCIINTIINKKYFSQYCNDLDELNKYIIEHRWFPYSMELNTYEVQQYQLQ